jgi:hypothetical protein
LKIAHDGVYAKHSGDPDDTFISVRWKKWAQTNADTWQREQGLDLSGWEIIRQPPQYQVKVADGQLRAQERSAPALLDLESVTELVYAVRNNLFHGGKWALRDPARSRDERLLVECIKIIEAFLEIDPELKKPFFDLGPSPT